MRDRQRLLISEQHIAFAGAFGATAMHRHGALVLLAGFSGPIRVRLATQSSGVQCWSALIEADESHAVDFGGEYVGALYFEPESVATRLLRHRFLQDASAAFDVIPAAQFKSGLADKLLDARVDDIFSVSGLVAAPRSFDPRIRAVIAALRSASDAKPDRGAVARRLVLSPSRFSHLFKEEARVSFQRYRLWSQVKKFATEVGAARDYTEAALQSGFYDAAHMNKTFRSFFGVAPSTVLSTLDEVSISA